VTQDDLLYRFRLPTLAVTVELGNVRVACRARGIHPSTYYRWKRQLDRYGPEILRPASAGCRAWPIRPVSWSSSGWLPLPSATRALGRPRSPPSSPNPGGRDQAVNQ
jgi:hypothetical protein